VAPSDWPAAVTLGQEAEKPGSRSCAPAITPWVESPGFDTFYHQLVGPQLIFLDKKRGVFSHHHRLDQTCIGFVPVLCWFCDGCHGLDVAGQASGPGFWQKVARRRPLGSDIFCQNPLPSRRAVVFCPRQAKAGSRAWDKSTACRPGVAPDDHPRKNRRTSVQTNISSGSSTPNVMLSSG